MGSHWCRTAISLNPRHTGRATPIRLQCESNVYRVLKKFAIRTGVALRSHWCRTGFAELSKSHRSRTGFVHAQNICTGVAWPPITHWSRTGFALDSR